MIVFNIGDTIVATERIWSKDLGKNIKEGTKIKVETMDDIITLPSPEKWKKNDKKI